ncbi:MAG TPA: hypothetical protein VN325_23130, partial [Steroidobacteraceae bacterium]|nr:hypothetical protein [Steroidobacteraceae bacterium]
AAPSPSGDPTPADLERELFVRGKQVLGKGAGGLIVRVLRAKHGDFALARAAIETASTKQNPTEWIGGLLKINGGSNGYHRQPPRPFSREDRIERTARAWDKIINPTGSCDSPNQEALERLPKS